MDRAAAPFERLRVERAPHRAQRFWAPAQARSLGAYRSAIALAPRGALVEVGAKKPFPICIANWRVLANTAAISPGPCSLSCSDIASTTVSFRLSIHTSLWLCRNSMKYQNGQPVPGHAPGRAHSPPSDHISTRQVAVPHGAGAAGVLTPFSGLPSRPTSAIACHHSMRRRSVDLPLPAFWEVVGGCLPTLHGISDRPL